MEARLAVTLRRVDALALVDDGEPGTDDQISVSDSTVICEYLDERFPAPRLLPEKPADRARARSRTRRRVGRWPGADGARCRRR